MKKILLFLAILLAINGLNAQGYYKSFDHHDISLSYGIVIPDQIKHFSSKTLDDLYPDELYVRDRYSSPGALFLTYRHKFRNDFMFWGITFGMSSSSGKIYNMGQYEGEIKRKFYTGAFDWEYRYFNQGIIQVYSGIGLGFTFGNETFTPNEITQESTGTIANVAFQVNAVGIRVGKRIGGYIEFGYGYKGVVNLGFSAQLY